MYHPRCYGDHYDIGFRYGSKLKKNHVIKQRIDKIDGFQLHYGTESEKILKQYFPEACDEMRGIADGLEVLYEKLAPWMMCISVCLEIPGCSMIAFKKNKRIIFGRNNDLPPVFRKLSNSTLYKPAHGYSFIANSSAFVHAEDGINEKGLAVGMTSVWAKDLKPGFSSMFFVRYILETCADISEATEAVKEIPIGGAYHLIAADEKEIVHFECSPQKLIINKGNSFAATNHFISEAMKAYEEEENLYLSHERYTTAKTALTQESCVDPLRHAKHILSGKHGFMCQYSKDLHFDTVWSSLYDITGKKVYRAEGNPQNAAFQEDTRLKELSKADTY